MRETSALQADVQYFARLVEWACRRCGGIAISSAASRPARMAAGLLPLLLGGTTEPNRRPLFKEENNGPADAAFHWHQRGLPAREQTSPRPPAPLHRLRRRCLRRWRLPRA